VGGGGGDRYGSGESGLHETKGVGERERQGGDACYDMMKGLAVSLRYGDQDE